MRQNSSIRAEAILARLSLKSCTTNHLTVANSNWQIADTADFDGDGRADILWRQVLTGETNLWLMDGPTRTSFTTLGNSSDPNWQIIA